MMQRTRDAWRRHRIRRGDLLASYADVRAAFAPFDVRPPRSARDVNRIGYFELLVAASSDVLELERQPGRQSTLAEMLMASGAIYGAEEAEHA